jgi:MmpS family membrane protein
MKRRWAIVGMALALTSCGSAVNQPSNEVSYDVTGTATHADIVYENAEGGTSEIVGASLPWNLSWTGARSGEPLYISAQITVATGGDVTVTIAKDGATVKTSTASGDDAVATASATY